MHFNGLMHTCTLLITHIFPAVPRTSEPFSYHYVFNIITRDIEAINVSWPRVDVSYNLYVLSSGKSSQISTL